MDMQRRTSLSGDPIMQVVGFRVEGQAPSPVTGAALAEAATMDDSMTTVGSGGSERLVLIPPAHPKFNAGEDQVSPSSVNAYSVAVATAKAEATFGGVATAEDAQNAADSLVVQASASSASMQSSATNAAGAVGTPQQFQAEAETSASDMTSTLPAPASSKTEISQGDTSKGAESTAESGGKGSKKKEKEKGPPREIEKKPKLSKAERRELQEKQRAAKAAAKAEASGSGNTAGSVGGGGKSAAKAPEKAAQGHKSEVPSHQADSNLPSKEKQKPSVKEGRQMELFAHLQQYHKTNTATLLSRDVASVHPAILDLGLQLAERRITGSNARTVAMLEALRRFVADYKTPGDKLLSRDLTQRLNKQIEFLAECRPLAIAMGNAIKHLKLVLSQLDPGASEDDAKATVSEAIESYIQEKVVFAVRALAGNAVSKINDGDVLLTYAYSHAVLQALLEAHQQGRRFRVVVVDARPHHEGQDLLQKLLDEGINCSFVNISSASLVMKQVTKVFLGAAAVLSNGVVLSRIGTAAVAMTAAEMHRPVMVCCETHKFSERVQLDSITSNELGDPGKLVAGGRAGAESELVGWESQTNLNLLNLTYDAMPADYVTMIVTEVGMVPPSSVPVILREYMKDTKATA